jgi:hypothetical protein
VTQWAAVNTCRLVTMMPPHSGLPFRSMLTFAKKNNKSKCDAAAPAGGQTYVHVNCRINSKEGQHENVTKKPFFFLNIYHLLKT